MKKLSLLFVAMFLPATSLFSGWSIQTTQTNLDLHGVSFADQNNGWACGENGTILHTSNGGDTWGPPTSPTPYALHAIYFVDDSKGWAVGAAETIIHTSDGGLSWIPQHSGTNCLYGVHFLNQSEGWAVGELGTVLHTTTGGGSWSLTFPTVDQFLDVFFSDQDSGWAVGRSIPRGLIGRSTDGGGNWTFTYPDQYLYDVHFIDCQRGWACGTNGEIMHTTDGGGSWNSQHSGGPHLNGIWLTDADNGWAVGDLGTILKTSDGATWTPDTSPVGVDLHGVWFTDINSGWAVGEGGTIIHYSGVGVTETPIINDQLPMTNSQLLQNYPNPFGRNTLIRFSISNFQFPVSVTVHDLSGRLVRTLLDERSNHPTIQLSSQVVWDGRDDAGREVSSGVYLCQLRTGDVRETRVMTLLK